MKTISLFIIIAFLFCAIQAQIPKLNYSKKDAYIGASILVVTFTTLETKGHQMTYGQRSMVAMSGIVISAGYSLLKATDFGHRIQRRFKLWKQK